MEGEGVGGRVETLLTTIAFRIIRIGRGRFIDPRWELFLWFMFAVVEHDLT